MEEVKDKVSYGSLVLCGVVVGVVVCSDFVLFLLSIACGALQQWCRKGLASAIVKMVVMKSKVFRKFLEREPTSKMVHICSSDRVTLTWLTSSLSL